MVFKLDESFENPHREVHSSPYEITEAGWGECDIFVKIYFKDPKENPVSFYHRLDLFPNKENLLVNKNTIAIEAYDEMIFPDPSNWMRSLLKNENDLKVNKFFFDFDLIEDNLVNGIQKAQEKVNKEITAVKENINKKLKDV